jgi:UDP-N-acetylglucosamine--N-acetylmuramyl-(pentapeptide) pyrophosphoryl-undecaprenol N-acetylglucosamine transferase
MHDSDAVAGLANRFLARFVDRIAIAYEGAYQFFPAKKTALVGNPIRTEMTEGNVAEAIDTFALQVDKALLLVLGGSLGAQTINKHLLTVLPALIEKGYQVVHITGENNFEEIVNSAKEYGLDIVNGSYRPVPFLGAKPLADLYAAAQVVLSRAGAGTIAELAANKKAVILVPLKSAANNEQRMNAYELAERGAVKVLEEANLTEHMILENLEELLTNQALREGMGEALSHFYHPDAAETIAEALVALARA